VNLEFDGYKIKWPWPTLMKPRYLLKGQINTVKTGQDSRLTTAIRTGYLQNAGQTFRRG
jgi:hypothetical protein